MKPKYRRWPARFEPGDRFEPARVSPVPFRGAVESELDRFKDRLLLRLLGETSEHSLRRALRHAATEAAALAWTTPFPLLFLPALLDEKTQAVRRYAVRQAKVRRHRQSPVNGAA